MRLHAVVTRGIAMFIAMIAVTWYLPTQDYNCTSTQRRLLQSRSNHIDRCRCSHDMNVIKHARCRRDRGAETLDGQRNARCTCTGCYKNTMREGGAAPAHSDRHVEDICDEE